AAYTRDGRAPLSLTLGETEAAGSGVDAVAVVNGAGAAAVHEVAAVRDGAGYAVAAPIDVQLAAALAAGGAELHIVPPTGEYAFDDGASIAVGWWTVPYSEAARVEYATAVRLRDRAGNESDPLAATLSAVTILDTIAPGDPTFVAHVHGEDGATVTLQYEIPDRSNEYTAWMRYDDGSGWREVAGYPVELSGTAEEAELAGTIDVGLLEADVAVAVEMWLVDRAGNASATTVPRRDETIDPWYGDSEDPAGVVYTLPENGVAGEAILTGLDEEGLRYIEVPLSAGGANHGHRIELYARDPTVETDQVPKHVGPWWPAEPDAAPGDVAPYRWTESAYGEIERHGEYWVVLRARNGSGDAALDVAQPVRIAVPNVAPTVPAVADGDIIGAGGYNAFNAGGVWWVGGAFAVDVRHLEETDNDGDVVEYRLHVVDAASGDAIAVGEPVRPHEIDDEDDERAEVVLPADTEHAALLRWYVSAVDVEQLADDSFVPRGEPVVEVSTHVATYDGRAPGVANEAAERAVTTVMEGGDAFAVPSFFDPDSGLAPVELVLESFDGTQREVITAESGAPTGLPEGRYRLAIVGVDRVGNRYELPVRTALIDRTAPADTLVEGVETATRLTYITPRMRWADYGGDEWFGDAYKAGTERVEYAFTDAAGDTPRLDEIGSYSVGGETGGRAWPVSVAVPAQRDEAYHLQVRVVDAIGNAGEWIGVGPMTVDRTPPEVDTIELSGGVWSHGVYWVREAHGVGAEVSATDTHGVVTEIAWRDADDAEVAVGDVEIGAAMTFAVIVSDGLGNRNETHFPMIRGEEPVIALVTEEPHGAVSPGQVVTLRVETAAFGIGEVGVALLDDTGDAVTMDAPGGTYRADERVWLDWSGRSVGRVSLLIPPATVPGSYRWSVVARAVDGTVGAAYETAFAIEYGAALAVTLPDGVVSNETERLGFGWELLGDDGDLVTEIEYLVRAGTTIISGAVEEVLGDRRSGAVEIAGLDLLHGEVYELEVTARRRSAGPIGAVRTLHIDTRAPEIDGDVTRTALWTQSQELSVRWRAVDDDGGGVVWAEAGVRYLFARELEADRWAALYGAADEEGRLTLEEAYEAAGDRYALRDGANEDEVAALFATHPIEAGGPVALSVSGSDHGDGVVGAIARDGSGALRPLHSGDRVRIEIDVADEAGNRSSWWSEAVVVDDSAPGEVLLTDGTAYAQPTADMTVVYGAPEDEESGIAEVAWATMVDTVDTDEIAEEHWQAIPEGLLGGVIGVSAETTAAGHGSVVYVALRTTNRAGIAHTQITDGVMLDDTAPVSPSVALSGGGSANGIYYTPSHTTELTAAIDNLVDVQSGVVRVEWTREIDDSHWIEVDPAIWQGDTAVIALDGPWSDDAAYPTVVRIRAINGAGLASSGMSGPIVADRDDPTVDLVWADARHRGAAGRDGEAAVVLDDIALGWGVRRGGSPIVGHRIAIRRDLTDAVTVETGDEAAHTIADEATLRELSGGWYTVDVTAVAASGRESTTTAIDAFIVDRIVPTIVFDRIEPAYADVVDERLRLTANPAGIGASGYRALRYRAGTLDDPGAVSDGWIATSPQDETHIDGFGALAHGDFGYVGFEVQNGVGIWAHRAYPPLEIDHVDPEVERIEANPFMNALDGGTLGGVGIAASDDGGGVAAYELVIRDGESVERYRERREIDGTPRDDGTVSDWEVSVTVEDGYYELVVRAVDAVGRLSAPLSIPFEVDTVLPEVAFDTSSWPIDGQGAAVINPLFFEVPFTVSEASEVALRLDGATTTVDPGEVRAYDWSIDDQIHFSFAAGEYGYHTLVAASTDRAGNIATHTASVRYNRPPEVATAYGEVDTRPGEPKELPTSTVVDHDGDAVTDIVWVYGDGTEETRPWTVDEVWVHVYLQENGEVVQTHYDASVRVVDEYGAWSDAAPVAITVSNSGAGRMYVDEYWSGEHLLTGEVFVPAGLTLTIVDGARIVALEAGRIRVAGELVVDDTGAGVTTLSAAGEKRWGGIVVEGAGTAGIDGATISGARSAVA
ncbi:MAG: hypothetical protein MI724_07950, partial [Spirochaetales bacterium]|nr:hypothetical protein [Spirochaetales bacterium]